MCGRITLRTPTRELAEAFLFDYDQPLTVRYNLAPTQQTAIVRLNKENNGRKLALVRWGLIPSWAKEEKIGSRLINARAETVAEKPSFRAAFKRRRCLVLADGYYEWRQEDGKKQPYLIELPDSQPFALAGLWESWRGPDRERDEPLVTCTIITTDANNQTAEIHDRMPVILPDDAQAMWLDTEVEEPNRLTALLKPYRGDLELTAVSTHVNNARHDDPECVTPAAKQGDLFES